MSVVAADLLSPTGDLVLSLFPGEDNTAVTSRLNAYITEGVAKAAAIADATERDKATMHWAYYRAYTAIFVRMSGDPTSASLASSMLSASYSPQQIKNFSDLAAAHRADFETILATGMEQPSTSFRPAASSASSVNFAW